MSKTDKKTVEQAGPPGLSLRMKFCLGIIVVLFSLSGLLSYGLYKSLEKSLIDSVYEKSEIILAELEATRQYVRDTLRPRVSALVSTDDFVREAMSTSYVTRKIMDRFHRWHPEFSYKRVALNPRNPMNQANPFEIQFIRELSGKHETREWQGIVANNGHSLFVRMSPIVMEQGCLRCHGDPAEAPRKLVEIYGDKRGFGRKLGQVAGIDVVSFPVERAMAKIRRQAATLLGIGGITTIVIFMFTAFLFDGLVVRRIGRLKKFFKDFGERPESLEKRLAIDQRDEIGEVYHAFNLMADQLQRLIKQREDLLRDSIFQRKRISSVFDAITDRLMLVSPDYSVIMANPAATKLSTSLDVTGKMCFKLLFNLDEPCEGCLLQSVAQKGRPAFSEINLPDGETYLTTLYPILDEETSRTKSVVHYCRSITEKKRMEQNMVQAEKLASLGQVVAGVAHELNNPLGVILFHVDLLKHELSGQSQFLQDLDIIEKHADSCKIIVEDLLKFARNVKAETTMSDVNETLETVLAVLDKQFEKDRIAVEKNLDSNIPYIPLDESKIRQVWMNLLLNAKHATRNCDGIITVTSCYNEDAGRVEVAIRDNGEGMVPEVLQRIFDPFFTTKEIGEGTGLGLSVTYGILKQHGGDIEVWSVPGKGTVFEVRLPGRNDGRINS